MTMAEKKTHCHQLYSDSFHTLSSFSFLPHASVLFTVLLSLILIFSVLFFSWFLLKSPPTHYFSFHISFFSPLKSSSLPPLLFSHPSWRRLRPGDKTSWCWSSGRCCNKSMMNFHRWARSTRTHAGTSECLNSVLFYTCLAFLPQLHCKLERELELEHQQLPEEICQHLQVELKSKGLRTDALFSPLSNHSSPNPSSDSGPPSNCSTPSYPSTPNRSPWNRSMDNSTASLAESTSSSTTPVLSEAEMSFS